MTYEQIKELQVSDVIITTDLTKLTKQCLSIVDTSKLKDGEILMLINAGVLDMQRQAIAAEKNIQNQLILAGIVMFVKSNFGMCDVKEKELAEKRYVQLCNNLSLSSEYQLQEEVDTNA